MLIFSTRCPGGHTETNTLPSCSEVKLYLAALLVIMDRFQWLWGQWPCRIIYDIIHFKFQWWEFVLYAFYPFWLQSSAWRPNAVLRPRSVIMTRALHRSSEGDTQTPTTVHTQTSAPFVSALLYILMKLLHDCVKLNSTKKGADEKVKQLLFPGFASSLTWAADEGRLSLKVLLDHRLIAQHAFVSFFLP